MKKLQTKLKITVSLIFTNAELIRVLIINEA